MALIEVKDSEFEEKVLKASMPVLVDFWAPWCGPCKMAAPVLDELAEDYKGKAEIMKVNVDENQAMPEKYSIMSIPTTILFKDGKEIARQVGFTGKQAFEDTIKKGL